jgi:rhodanese-related sulfurtransferase
MTTHSDSISVSELQSRLAAKDSPVVIDVRRQAAFLADEKLLGGALRRDPEHLDAWSKSLPSGGEFVVYCVRGHEVSQDAARGLASRGITARYLEGGLGAWIDAGGGIDSKPRGASTRWVTRERPKIDRIACPWLIARFVDADAEFVYVPTSRVLEAAAAQDAIPYDIPGVHFSHEGDHCSFDAFLKHYRLRDPALEQLALIVRGADTAHLELSEQAPGLAAISLGLSRNFADDHEMLGHGMVMYDALYTWCKEGKEEVHTWNPRAYGTRVEAEAV